MGSALLHRLLKSSRRHPDPSILYDAIVDQARQPHFFAVCGVPDTVFGRFDLLVLHAFLVLRRLNQAGNALEDFRQALFDHMFRDMDASLRELGVGDLSVPKKIKRMAQGFYGKVVAYEKALAGSDDDIAEALRRNLFSDAAPDAAQVGAIVVYLRVAADRVASQEIGDIVAGRVAFGPAPTLPGSGDLTLRQGLEGS